MGNLACDFTYARNKLKDRDYLLSTILYYAAPVNEGIKPGCLINFTSHSRNMYSLWYKYKEDIEGRLKLNVWEFIENKNRVSVLFYDWECMNQILNKNMTMDYLNNIGYNSKMDIYQCFQLLQKRFEICCPHEIGFFLGIPLNDVTGFIQNNGRNYLINGYWKVYHDPQNAVNTFKAYDQAKRKVLRSIQLNDF